MEKNTSLDKRLDIFGILLEILGLSLLFLLFSFEKSFRMENFQVGSRRFFLHFLKLRRTFRVCGSVGSLHVWGVTVAELPEIADQIPLWTTLYKFFRYSLTHSYFLKAKQNSALREKLRFFLRKSFLPKKTNF